MDSFSDTYKNNFTYEGKLALFDYLEEYEESTDTPVELDTVALCCEYTEYDNLADVLDNYTNIHTHQLYHNHQSYLISLFHVYICCPFISIC